MSETSIVSIIVALIGSLTAIIIKLIEKPGNIKRELSKDKAIKEQKTKKLTFIKITYYLSILIALGGAGTLVKQEVFKSEPKISITYPASNDNVEQTVRVEGTYKDIPKGDKIWIFINPLEINRYYPQNSYAELDANGKWSSLVYFGQDNDRGRKFEVIVVLAKSDVIQEIENYLKVARDKQDWSGMEKLPENAVIYERKIVTRN